MAFWIQLDISRAVNDTSTHMKPNDKTDTTTNFLLLDIRRPYIIQEGMMMTGISVRIVRAAVAE